MSETIYFGGWERSDEINARLLGIEQAIEALVAVQRDELRGKKLEVNNTPIFEAPYASTPLEVIEQAVVEVTEIGLVGDRLRPGFRDTYAFISRVDARGFWLNRTVFHVVEESGDASIQTAAA